MKPLQLHTIARNGSLIRQQLAYKGILRSTTLFCLVFTLTYRSSTANLCTMENKDSKMRTATDNSPSTRPIIFSQFPFYGKHQHTPPAAPG
ncbi:hypothetical protein K458DRAFT_134451 [Lentithecium fluviatile CBS 122367]|uniref:Uncharacterized protein n=1 Tax=Lentithecium fluviatile CBS 122367 TaxID=1168545 RepID=A0A6G1IKG2_9PLEO|nr:hypothetical protein K458DRAFT_134451 [Lentithecium fluviatile CBS 122367]